MRDEVCLSASLRGRSAGEAGAKRGRSGPVRRGRGRKKAFLLIWAIASAVALCPAGECADKKVSAKTARAKKIPPKKMQELLEHMRTELERGDWTLQLVAPNGEGEKKTDTVIFKDRRFTSNAMLAKGFASSNYTLTIQDDGIVVFETMQTHEKEGTVFWRGEFEEASHAIRGMVGKVMPNQKRMDLSFLGTQQQSASEEAEESINPNN